MKIKAVLVDVGGVLVQTVHDSHRAQWESKLHLLSGALAKEVYQLEPGDLATIGKVKSEVIWQDVQKKFGLTDVDLTQLKGDFYAGDRLNTEYYNFLKEVHEKYPVTILSNAWLDAREVYTNRYHLDEIVDEMIISAEEGLRKPDGRIYTLALNRLGQEAFNVLYIDDDKDNIRTASAMGLQTIQFVNTEDTIQRMKKFL